VIKARAARLREKADQVLAAHLDGMIGTVTGALMEKPGFARAGNFAAIRLPETEFPRAGALVNVTVTHHDGRELFGELAS
jgi:threonylcarbamoyladenosine tRNA methylthiotransferase MtaB